MPTIPERVHTKEALRLLTSSWRKAGQTIAFVPTMGFLHSGHLSLIHQAQRLADRVVVSIFVNPTQFGPHEDFNSYPRNVARDLEYLKASTDLVYLPEAEHIYPSAFSTTVSLQGPAAVGLEDRMRPTHFAGVATVVTKLLMQVAPTSLILGEKDFQQLRVIDQLIEDLHLPVTLIPGKTVREPDGLACSSRNARLTHHERQQASQLYNALCACAKRLKKGEPRENILAEESKRLMDFGWKVDYLEVRDGRSLCVPHQETPLKNLRLLVAARLGSTRLIDNCAIEDAG
jgi:pantoate--beta-alanine ligase